MGPNWCGGKFRGPAISLFTIRCHVLLINECILNKLAFVLHRMATNLLAALYWYHTFGRFDDGGWHCLRFRFNNFSLFIWLENQEYFPGWGMRWDEMMLRAGTMVLKGGKSFFYLKSWLKKTNGVKGIAFSISPSPSVGLRMNKRKPIVFWMIRTRKIPC